jgi:Fur family zinc uptake transcriptional regulator
LVDSEILCRTRGARLTPIRRKVLEVLLEASKPLGAYDLVDMLASQGRRMAPITVYRALDFLIEQGLAYRLASRNAYIAGSGSSGTTTFLICEACGDAAALASSDVADTVLKVLTQQGYQPRARALEITGRCPHCQDMH